uniref:Uncharacterized protein n=1 Tax=Ackermannviridae sp. TaxID=2831612 RepID=A0A8S5VXA6_9CAUD|nr:MAG TPA: hypothetical protein [Ackermannviridae sp.]
MRALLSLLPWLCLAALIWYMAACVVADKKPKAAQTAALMLATWLLAIWAS